MKFREEIMKNNIDFLQKNSDYESLEIKPFWIVKVESFKIPNPDSMRVKSSNF